MGFEELLGVNPWTALFILLNTLAIFFVARKYLFGPVQNLIKERQQEIDDTYAQADAARQEALDMKEEYRQKLDDATDTGERLVREAVARGQSREEEILRQANAQADAIRQKAEEDIAREKKKAINEAKDEISSMAMAIAGKVVGKELTDADQANLVDDFIDELGGAL